MKKEPEENADNVKEKEFRIYDSIFRTLCSKNPRLLIYLINEVFHMGYGSGEKIELLAGEHHYIDTDTGKIKEIITDLAVKIKGRIYHVECQSTEDGSIVLRMVEYDFHIALERAVKGNDGYEIEFPSPALLYLGNEKYASAYVKIKINFPDGQSMVYSIPVIRAQNYSAKDITGRKLFFLIPYYIMRYEKDEDGILPVIRREYPELLTGMEEACKAGYIDGYDMSNIMDLTKRLLYYLYPDNEDIQREVKKIMGGQVLETWADKKIKQSREQGFNDGKKQGFNDGKKQGFNDGKKQGFNDGKRQNQIKIILNMSKKGYDASIISDATGIPFEEVKAALLDEDLSKLL